MTENIFDIQSGEVIPIEDTIASTEGEIKNVRFNQALTLLGVIIILAIAAAIIITHQKEISDQQSGWRLGVSMGAGFGIPILIVLLMAAYSLQVHMNSLKSMLDGYKRKQKNTQQHPEENQKLSYFDQLVVINARNLEGNYNLVKKQNETSFRVTMIMNILGFIFISIGLSISFINLPHLNNLPYISSGAGIVIEIISSIFFVFHSKNVQQMKYYHRDTLKAQNILFAFQLVENTKDETTKAKIIAMMAARLMEEPDTSTANEK